MIIVIVIPNQPVQSICYHHLYQIETDRNRFFCLLRNHKWFVVKKSVFPMMSFSLAHKSQNNNL